MQRLKTLAVIFIVIFALYGCNEETKATAANVPEDQIAATVNGTVISNDDVAHFKQLKGNPQVADDKLVEEIVATELLRQEAVKAGIADKADVRYQLKLQESETLARLLMREKFSSLTFTDEQLQAEYDKQLSGQDSREFNARHILLKTEDEAKAVIEALRAGGDFVELAKERSTGPSGPNGGDLGWFQATSMVPPFAEAVKAMNKSDVSVTPVQTQFGWHVIKLEDTRELPKPGFDSVKEQLQQSLLREAINSYIKDIREASEIAIK